MTFIDGLILLTAVHTLYVISPGANSALVIQQALSNGKKAGLFCSLGVTLGFAVSIVIFILGIAALVEQYPAAFSWVKVAGAAYLLYLGFTTYRTRIAVGSDQIGEEYSSGKARAFKTTRAGFFCSVLNPTAPIYLLALFAGVLSPGLSTQAFSFYIAWMLLIYLFWFCLVTVLFSMPAIQDWFTKMGIWVNRSLGALIMVLGVCILAGT